MTLVVRENVESKYLTFSRSTPQEIGRKTKVWTIRAKRTDAFLGTVSWFGRWRCYAFHPQAPTTFNDGCLRDIADFCERKTAEHAVEVVKRSVVQTTAAVDMDDVRP